LTSNAYAIIVTTMSKHPLKVIYWNMIWRCKESSQNRSRYFDRGIKVCDEWVESFDKFKSDIEPIYKKGLQLDRINNNDGYKKENVRFVSARKNLLNTCRNHSVEFNGQNLTISELAEKIGCKQNTLLRRIKRGWKIEDAVAGKRVVERKSRYGSLIEELCADRNKGMKLTDIAKKYSMDNGNLSRFFRKQNVISKLKTAEEREIRKKNK
jgi:hypothetical protein